MPWRTAQDRRAPERRNCGTDLRPDLDDREPQHEVDLELVHLDDGIEVTARLRAMIHVTTTDDMVGDVELDLLRQSQD